MSVPSSSMRLRRMRKPLLRRESWRQVMSTVRWWPGWGPGLEWRWPVLRSSSAGTCAGQCRKIFLSCFQKIFVQIWESLAELQYIKDDLPSLVFIVHWWWSWDTGLCWGSEVFLWYWTSLWDHQEDDSASVRGYFYTNRKLGSHSLITNCRPQLCSRRNNSTHDGSAGTAPEW